MIPRCVTCDDGLDAYGRDGVSCHRCNVAAAIDRYNNDASDGGAYARRPILATDCDYEIVRRSGVQGMRL